MSKIISICIGAYLATLIAINTTFSSACDGILSCVSSDLYILPMDFLFVVGF
jgi:hypothetical protein